MLRVIPETKWYSPVKNYVYAGIDSPTLNTVFASQNSPNACWAANLQTYAGYLGLNIPQDIFKGKYCGVNESGEAFDCAAPVEVITGYFNSFLATCNIKATLFRGSPKPELLVALLKENVPVIAAYKLPGAEVGHAILITGISFVQSVEYYDDYTALVVRDPSPHFANQPNKGRLVYNNPYQLLKLVHSWWVPEFSPSIKPVFS